MHATNAVMAHPVGQIGVGTAYRTYPSDSGTDLPRLGCDFHGIFGMSTYLKDTIRGETLGKCKQRNVDDTEKIHFDECAVFK